MSRLIDSEPAPVNPQPIEVMILGLPRTGTNSIFEALNILGYKAHHMKTCMQNPRVWPMWNEAMRLEYPELDTIPKIQSPGQKPYGRAELDTLLQGFTATTDIPSALFPRALITSYFFTQLCDCDPDRMTEGYERHNANVRRIAKEQGRELLEFDVTMGWGPLCELLGKPVPEEPFPNVNDGEKFGRMMFWMRNFFAAKMR